MNENTEKALSPFEEREMIYTMDVGGQMRLTANMVKRYLVQGQRDYITDDEVLFFMQTCKALRVNPFLRECWLIKYSKTEAAQIIVSIHHLRDLSMTHSLCEGWQKGLIVWSKEKGELRTHGFVPPGYDLVGAWFKARPKGWTFDYELEINLSGYIKYKSGGGITAFWTEEKQPSQLMKVVESQGLRSVFTEKTRGLYVKEEFNINPEDSDIVDIGSPAKLPGPETPEKPAEDLYAPTQEASETETGSPDTVMGDDVAEMLDSEAPETEKETEEGVQGPAGEASGEEEVPETPETPETESETTTTTSTPPPDERPEDLIPCKRSTWERLKPLCDDLSKLTGKTVERKEEVRPYTWSGTSSRQADLDQDGANRLINSLEFRIYEIEHPKEKPPTQETEPPEKEKEEPKDLWKIPKGASLPGMFTFFDAYEDQYGIKLIQEDIHKFINRTNEEIVSLIDPQNKARGHEVLGLIIVERSK